MNADRHFVAAGGADLRAQILVEIDILEALSRDPGFAPHHLFAGLYAKTIEQLVPYVDTLADPVPYHLTILRFFDLYERQVMVPARSGRTIDSRPWRAYGAFAQQLPANFGINDTMRLLVLGAWAHTRFDVGEAVYLAIHDHRRLLGRAPDLEAMRAALLGRRTSRGFRVAALSFNAMRRRQERGLRRLAITGHAVMAHLTIPLWIDIVQTWRRAAWSDAMAALDEERDCPDEPFRRSPGTG